MTDGEDLLNFFRAFNDALRVTMEFAKPHGYTLIPTFPDHNTGDIAIGSQRPDASYADTTIEQLLYPLKRMHISGQGVGTKMGAYTFNIFSSNLSVLCYSYGSWL